MTAPRRGGYTLMETAVSLSASAVLLLAMGSMMVLAGQALPDGQTRSSRAAEAARALDVLADDAVAATTVQAPAGSTWGCTVADRSGDGFEERGQYRLDSGALVRVWTEPSLTETKLVTGVASFTPTLFRTADNKEATVVEFVLVLQDMPGEPFRRSVALLNEPEVK